LKDSGILKTGALKSGGERLAEKALKNPALPGKKRKAC
jgi:hypothetical protein